MVYRLCPWHLRQEKGNIEKIEKVPITFFDKRVQYLLAHPDEASWFFSTKFISSWTEGSFQSIWNGPSKDKFQPLWNRVCDFHLSRWDPASLFVTYMQGYLLVLYLGGVFYYAFTYKRMGDGATLGLYAFLYLFGGILFHLISETKSQYTLPYIYLQIPMIAAGYNHMTQILSRYLKNRRKSSLGWLFVIVSQLQSCYNSSMKKFVSWSFTRPYFAVSFNLCPTNSDIQYFPATLQYCGCHDCGTFSRARCFGCCWSFFCYFDLVIGFALGVGNGMGVVIARYYGAQDFRKLRQSVAATVVIGLGLSALVMILGHFGLYPLLRFLGTPASIIGQSYQYISMIVSCVGVTLGYNLCAGLLRAVGDSLTALYFLIFSALVNIVLDLFFITQLHLGVQSAELGNDYFSRTFGNSLSLLY